MDKSKTILAWRFEDAPKEYQDLIEKQGDEDWLAFVPDALLDPKEEGYIGVQWIAGSGFDSLYDPQEFKVEGGYVYIGEH